MSKRKQNRKEVRRKRGEKQLLNDFRQKQFDNDWKLDWFHPQGLQREVIESIYHNTFTIVDAPSGCGKTSTAIWYGLTSLKDREVDHLKFIKNPTEIGDDKIGFLQGSDKDKLAGHLSSSKGIFHDFMHKNKLEADISREKIQLMIPNFELGSTWDSSFIIIDECQLMSPSTMKFLLERCGQGSKYVILGDSGQRYAVSHRQDGFRDLIDRVTESNCPSFGYIKMTRDDNQRSEGSKLINLLYEG